MADRFRGLTEADIKSDLNQLIEWHGSQGKAAQACGLATSTFGNARTGHAVIGDTVMNALYGPAPGNSLLPFLKPKSAAVPLSGLPPVAQSLPPAPEGVGECAPPAPSNLTEPEPQPSNPDASGELAGPVACGSTSGAEGVLEAGSEEAGAEDGAPASTSVGVEPEQEPAAEANAGSSPAPGNPLQAHIAKLVKAAAPEPLPAAPWSKLEDRDLVAILRGKLLGVLQEVTANERCWADLAREAERIQAVRLELERRETALEQAIQAFEQEGTDDAEGSDQAEAAE